MYIHCEGCARDIKENLIRMEGVFTVELDMGKSQVRVKGVFDPPKLAEIITKRLGKHVEIVKEEAIKKEEKKEKKKDEEENNCMVINYPPPPNDQQPLQNDDDYHYQIFSDENVNSTSQSTLERNSVPLHCDRSSNRLHVVNFIYRPFMDELEYMPLLVKNNGAEFLFGNIKAEKVYRCYKERKHDQYSDSKVVLGENHYNNAGATNIPKVATEAVLSSCSLDVVKKRQKGKEK
ncbi:hypothetical protein LWI28_015305 [Acer negundo]|uniref:HMA domain-containing protein n=1 Tax=Acer negundo TaxID=4023 RepID=A0AAD5J4X3_ACENE|nr:hypothetical protein LWI28_015305 [Acer negundo]